MPRKLIDMTGATVGRLTVISYVGPENGRAIWQCRCDCGNAPRAAGADLRSGKVRSCGCWSSDVTAARNRSHGLSDRPEYRVWASMRRRCNSDRSPDFESYKARGIRVCKRWDAFAAFFADMGPRPSPQHSIDRINNDGHYEPGNCRWAERTTQMRNRRSARLVTVGTTTASLAQVAEDHGIHPETLASRLDRGMTPEDLLGRQ